jgi:hypothetical protein
MQRSSLEKLMLYLVRPPAMKHHPEMVAELARDINLERLLSLSGRITVTPMRQRVKARRVERPRAAADGADDDDVEWAQPAVAAVVAVASAPDASPATQSLLARIFMPLKNSLLAADFFSSPAAPSPQVAASVADFATPQVGIKRRRPPATEARSTRRPHRVFTLSM